MKSARAGEQGVEVPKLTSGKLALESAAIQAPHPSTVQEGAASAGCTWLQWDTVLVPGVCAAAQQGQEV